MKGMRIFGPLAVFMGLIAVVNGSSINSKVVPVFGIAVAFFAGAVWTGMRTRAFLASAWNADGTVVEVNLVPSTYGRDLPRYHPTINFLTITGEEISFVSEFGSNPAAHKVGDRVTVYYDPHDPNTARVRSFTELWFMPALLTTFGVITLIGAIITAT